MSHDIPMTIQPGLTFTSNPSEGPVPSEKRIEVRFIGYNSLFLKKTNFSTGPDPCASAQPRHSNRTYPQYVSQVWIPFFFHAAHSHNSHMNAMMLDSTSSETVCSICAYPTGKTCLQQFRSMSLQLHQITAMQR